LTESGLSIETKRTPKQNGKSKNDTKENEQHNITLK